MIPDESSFAAVSRSIELLISPSLLEASNGSMLIAFIFCFCGAAFNVVRLGLRTWEATALPALHASRWGLFYRVGKPSLALAVMFGSLLLGTGARWLLRYLTNHGFQPTLLTDYADSFVLFGTIGTVVGALCWLRVTYPEWITYPGWIVMVLLSLGFGVITALG